MSDLLSCTKCGNRLAVESASGLCPACAPAVAPPTASFPGAPAGEPGTVTFPAPAPPSNDTPNAAADPTPPATAHPNPLAPTLTLPADAVTASGPAAGPAKAPKPLPADPVGYTLLDRIGEGGMGEVFRAHEHSTDQFVALKMIDPRHGGGSYFERFRLEFRALANFEHPNAVRGLKDRFDHNPPFFTMELVPGCTVSERLKSTGRYEPRAAVELIHKVAVAVQALHNHREFGHPFEGVIHRDIKPSNILLTADNEPKLADFGLVRYLDAETITSADVALGTPAYMPPEQCGGRHDAISYPADVYGLGATLYHMLTGEPPFRGTLVEIIAQVLHDDPKPVCERCPEVGEMLGRIVRACMYKQPEDRYQTVGALIADLDKWLNPKAEAPPTPPDPPPTPPEPPRANWVKRNAVALAACALLGVVGVLALVWPRWTVPSGDPHRPTAAEQNQRELELLQGDVRAKRLARVLGATGNPRYHEWLWGPATLGESTVGDGACYFQAAGGASALQLFVPPVDRYRISFQFQQVGGELDNAPVEPSVGVFLGHTAFPRAGAPPAHGFFLFHLLDLDRGALLGKAPTPQPVRFEWAHLVPPPNGLPGAHTVHAAGATFPARNAFPGAWWTVTADVSPAELVVRYVRDDGPEATLVQLRGGAIRDLFNVFKVQAQLVRQRAGGKLDFGPLPDDWNPTGGAGIWCARARVAFKNVTVSPLP